MAVRMKYLGVKAALVNGRVRDLGELRESELPVCLSPSFADGLADGSRYGLWQPRRWAVVPRQNRPREMCLFPWVALQCRR